MLISTDVQAQVFESAFDQWGVLEVKKLHDPVLDEPNGHVLVRLREHEQVGCRCQPSCVLDKMH